MHLVSISNLDYGMMAALFGVFLIISYYFRRKNRSTDDFLLMSNRLVFGWAILNSLISFGLLEFILLTSYGAKFGLAFSWVFLPIFLLISFFLEFSFTKSSIFASLTDVTIASNQTRAKLVYYAIFNLFVVAIVICIVVTMLKSLLGWEFANTTLSLLGGFLIAFLLGGIIAATYNQALVMLITTVIMLLGAVLAYKNIGFSNLVPNLQQLAVNNKLNLNTFTQVSFNFSFLSTFWLGCIASCLFLVINPLQRIRQNKLKLRFNLKITFVNLIKTALVFLMLLIGILCLATPSENTLIAGKKIITQQTRLNDGSIGYVVKAVNSEGLTQQRGLVPLQVDDSGYASNTLNNENNFDFLSAGMVMLKKVFPLAFVTLFLLVLFFFKSVSEGVFFTTLVIIKGFYVPKYNKTGEELENLWAAKVFMFTLVVVSVMLGLLMYRYCQLEYLLAVLLIIAMPITINIIDSRMSWIFDLIVYLILFLILALVKIPNVPSISGLISFNSLQSMTLCLTSSVTIIYLLAILLKKMLVKRK